VRYLFRGIVRESGRPVEGHVEGSTEEDAYSQWSSNGVVTESLVPDPKALNLNDELPQSPEFANALESAFDSSSSQIDFDDLTQRYTGKKVWVIDRDKIRRRVAQVVDAALALAAQHGEGSSQARERVQSALQGFFSDNRNLASERNAESVAGIRFNGGNAAPPPPPPPPLPVMPANARMAPYLPATNGGGSSSLNGHPGLEGQIARMANLVKQAEATLAAVAAAARRGGGGGGGGGGGRRFSAAKGGKGEEQNSVLLEIFKSNLELVRGMQDPTSAPADNGGAVAAEGAPAESSVLPSADAAGGDDAIETGSEEPISTT
jgi:hypothetical protein